MHHILWLKVNYIMFPSWSQKQQFESIVCSLSIHCDPQKTVDCVWREKKVPDANHISFSLSPDQWSPLRLPTQIHVLAFDRHIKSMEEIVCVFRWLENKRETWFSHLVISFPYTKPDHSITFINTKGWPSVHHHWNLLSPGAWPFDNTHLTLIDVLHLQPRRIRFIFNLSYSSIGALSHTWHFLDLQPRVLTFNLPYARVGKLSHTWHALCIAIQSMPRAASSHRPFLRPFKIWWTVRLVEHTFLLLLHL